MPVTVNPASHEPRPHPSVPHSKTLDNFVQLSCPQLYTSTGTTIHASSFSSSSKQLYASSSSFIRSAIEAWGRHSHLVLRPEDIWFTILVQMNYYMEAHAEELRHIFVAHEGQENIHCSGDFWAEIIPKFKGELHKKIKTDWMRDWITPGFSTSLEDDDTVATVLMMGLMKGYFTYSMSEICGIPSITLIGERKDWQRLLDKIDRLPDFGDEPRDYSTRLRPILSRIVNTFDDPANQTTRDFWDGMVHAKVRHACVCGQPPRQYFLTGWILGFFYWDITGHKTKKIAPLDWPADRDAIEYDVVPLEEIPVGYAKVNITLTSKRGKDGEPLKAMLVAGSMGKSLTRGAPTGYSAALTNSNSASETPKDINVPTKGRAQDTNLDTDADFKKTGYFSNLTHGLNCFSWRRRTTKKQISDAANEAIARKSVIASTSSTFGHSTIRPLSGWLLISPQKEERGLDFDLEDIDPSTSNAINSCPSVEHYGDMRGT